MALKALSSRPTGRSASAGAKVPLSSVATTLSEASVLRYVDGLAKLKMPVVRRVTVPVPLLSADGQMASTRSWTNP